MDGRITGRGTKRGEGTSGHGREGGGRAKAQFAAVLGHSPAYHLPVPSICGVLRNAQAALSERAGELCLLHNAHRPPC